MQTNSQFRDRVVRGRPNAWFRVAAIWPHGRVSNVFIALFAVLLILWLLGFAAFHVAGGLIHLLLILAVISIVLHFIMGRRAV